MEQQIKWGKGMFNEKEEQKAMCRRSQVYRDGELSRADHSLRKCERAAGVSLAITRHCKVAVLAPGCQGGSWPKYFFPVCMRELLFCMYRL